MTVLLVPCMSKIFLSRKIDDHHRQLCRRDAGMLKADGAGSSAWSVTAPHAVWNQGELHSAVLPWAAACHELVQVGHISPCPTSLTANLLVSRGSAHVPPSSAAPDSDSSPLHSVHFPPAATCSCSQYLDTYLQPEIPNHAGFCGIAKQNLRRCFFFYFYR